LFVVIFIEEDIGNPKGIQYHYYFAFIIKYCNFPKPIHLANDLNFEAECQFLIHCISSILLYSFVSF